MRCCCWPQAAAFSLGLATTLAALGVASSALGRAYGQMGEGLPIGVSIVAILMGLNLLEVGACLAVPACCCLPSCACLAARVPACAPQPAWRATCLRLWGHASRGPPRSAAER